jgi:hypothetical protein
MITAIGQSKLIRAAKGQYIQTQIVYLSTTPLVGKFLQLNLQLFGSGTDPEIPTTNPWSAVYSIGTTVMNFTGDDKNRNLKVELIADSSTQFKVRISFLMVADVDNWIGVNGVNNNQIFTNAQFGAQTSIYNSLIKYLNVYININSQDLISSVTFVVDNQCTLSFPQLDFQVGTDLEINIVGSNNINHQFFFLFYDSTNIFNGVNFLQDLEVQYARITDTAYNVDDLPNDAIISGFGFQSGNAKVVIDGDHFEANRTYFGIVIYNQGGIWKSCVTPAIQQNGAGVPPIYGDIECTIEDTWFGQEVDGCCGRGIAEGQNLLVSVKADIASWDTEISNVYPGTFYDYFDFATIGFSNTIPTNSGSQVTSLNLVSTNLGVTEAIVRGSFYNQNAGQYYIVATFHMNYPDHSDTIVKVVPITLGVIDELGEILSIEDGDGVPIEGDICIAQNGDVIFTFNDLGSTPRVFYSINGGSWTPGDNAIVKNITQFSLAFDAGAVGLNNRICFRLLYTGTPSTSDPDTDCDCSHCPTNNTIVALSKSLTNDLFIPTTYPLIDGIWEVVTAQGTQYNGVITDGDAYIPLTTSEYPITLLISGSNMGCFYSSSFQVTAPLFELETRPLTLSECECEDTPITTSCNNEASILFECDPETETIDISYSEITFFPIEDDIQEISYDGGDTWEAAPVQTVGETNILLRRTMTFFGACPEIVVLQSVQCEGILICNNSRTLEYDITGGLLTITTTDDFNSIVLTDEVLVSIDGGITFDPYAEPVALSGGEEVVITSLVTFEDGCQSLVFQTSFLNDMAAQCDYDIFDVFCDEVTPGVFEATFEGDETQLVVNIKEYSTNGGSTFQEYTGSVETELFLVRWIIKYENCDTLTLVSACSPECKKIKLCEPIEIAGPLAVTVEGCVNFCEPCDGEINEFGICE